MLGRRQGVVSRVGHQQRTAELVHKFKLLRTERLQLVTHLPEATVALDALVDQVLVGSGDMDLTYGSGLGGREKLRLMGLPVFAVAARIATLAESGPKGATDQGAPFAQEELQLVLMSLPRIEQTLSKLTRTLAHG